MITGKQIIVIPDVHGRSFWKDAVRNLGRGPLVFLGDYLDPYPFEGITKEDALEGFKAILALKKEHPGEVTLLLGNHDCEYLYGRGVCDCRTDDKNYGLIQGLFRENKGLFQMAVQYKLGGKLYVFSHAGISPGWAGRHLGECPVDEMVPRLNELNEKALLAEYPDVTSFALALSECDRERGGESEYGSPIWADAECLHAGYQFSDIVQVVGHTQIPGRGPILTENILYTDCREVLALSQRGTLRHLSGKRCVNKEDPFNPDVPEWEQGKKFGLDGFSRPYCRCCGSRNIFIRTGMMASHWYCRDCHEDQIL